MWIAVWLSLTIRLEEIMEQQYDYDFDIYDLIDKWE
nr:MAG TPA: hypothetical protein [Caudoviricetes sp.]